MSFHVFTTGKLGMYLKGLLVFLGLILGTAEAAEQYHIVLDASGSIQRTDPEKQRIKELQRLVDELPDGSKAGLWTYAGQVNMLLPPSTVNAEWRKKAHEALSNVSGYGPYANLTMALSQASHAWRGTTAEPGRNIILVTNNGVKTSDSPEQNKAARDQLHNELLPQLKKSGVKIYDVGLSQADAALLKELAAETNGQYQQVASPGDLTKAFNSIESSLGLHAVDTAAMTTQNNSIENTPPATDQTAVIQPSTIIDTTVDTTAPAQNMETPAANAAVENVPANTTSENVISENATVSAENAPQTTTAPETIAPQNTNATAIAEPVPNAPPPALGAAEADEIRDALAEAETELQTLLDEFASSTKVGETSPAATLSGQQLSEPLVITLNDGSVLVTSNQEQAQQLSGTNTSSNAEATPSTSGATNNQNPANDVSAEESNMHGTATEVEWPSAQQRHDVWPLILSVLAVINIAVIALLFIGRYFWLRHKRKTNTGTF